MKLAIRIFALSIAVAGLASAATTPVTASAVSSHLSATGPLPSPDSMPGPKCGPHICLVGSSVQ